ncbi:hypothetical protein JCM1840_000693 [Sporobolomyces johnsonii]
MSSADTSYYRYVPSRALAVIALLTFGLSLICHLTNFVRLRSTRAFEGLLIVGSAMEIVGYSARLRSHFNPSDQNLFIVQYTFVVLAPVAFQAAFYVGLSQALWRLDCTGRSLLHFNPRILVWTMVVFDLVCTIVQIVGATLTGVAEAAQNDGSLGISSLQANDILLAGLSVQTASFVLFIALLILCIYRSATTYSAGYLPKRLSLLLFATSMLLLLRTTFRTAETTQGARGSANSSEVLFGCLEYLPVILAVGAWAAVSLDSVLPMQVDDERGRDVEKEKEELGEARIRRMRSETFELGANGRPGTRSGDRSIASASGSDRGSKSRSRENL